MRALATCRVAARRVAPRSTILGVVVVLLTSCGGAGAGSTTPPDGPPGLAFDAVLPDHGPLVGRNDVSLLGRGFATATAPLLLRVGARVVEARFVDDGVLQATMPAGDAVGALDVQLLTGAGVYTLAGGYAYMAPPPPAPTLAFEPRVGQPGTRIDLEVGHHPPLVAPEVQFGGIVAPQVTLLDATRLRVEVPAGLPPGVFVNVSVFQDGWQVHAPGFLAQLDPVPGEQVINELLPDPGSALDANRDGTASSAGDEMVEIVNRLGAPVDLTGFTLSDATNVRHTFPNPTTVPAGGSIVVFGSGNPTYFPARHASGHAQVASTGTLGLNNTSDSMVLRSPTGQALAHVTYSSAEVDAGVSRTAADDGQAQTVPVAASTYLRHDLAPGAVGSFSPGLRRDGTAFP